MSNCIIFEGGKRKSGYGYTQFMGRQFLAHRLAYSLNEWKHPDSLKGIVIRHKCDNPSCINVEHLEPGSYLDNNRDAIERGRNARGEKAAGAKLSASQIIAIRASYVRRSPTANQYQLGKKFNVSQSEISQILSSKRWAHV